MSDKLLIYQSEILTNCILCSSNGNTLFSGLTERLYGLPGKWSHKKCSNINCGLIWLDPMPKESELWKAYVSYYTHKNNQNDSVLHRLAQRMERGYQFYKYGYKNNISLIDKILFPVTYFFPTEKEQFDFNVLYLKNSNNNKLLDIGCGNGNFIKKLQGFGWDTYGIDMDEKAIAYCKSKKLNVSAGDIFSQNFNTNQFDVITINNVIEHLRHPIKVINKVYELLKPGGKLIVVTPNTESDLFFKYRSFWYHLDPPRHLFLFNEKNLQQMLEDNMFKITKSFSTSRNDFWVYFASKYIQDKGQFRPHDKSKMDIVKGKLAQIAIIFHKLFYKKAGGELMIIAEKK